MEGVSDIRIEAASASYTVHVGRGLLAEAGKRSLEAAGKVSRIFLVTSPQIDRLWGKQLRDSFAPLGKPLETLLIPAGEQHKRMRTIERLLEELATYGADRDTLIVAFGGGVIGDMAGFLAAIWMRGVPFVQIPTTLLAQVDSSVGGKTGANLGAGKNLVGSFHQPITVIADLDTLTTLPPREIRAGLQESVKAGVIRDADLFARMERDAERIRNGNIDALQPVIEASIRIKADVVKADEREGNLRMILNFGHTVGHAIEAATGYSALLHGEAIGWGMIAATYLAESRGVLSSTDAKRILSLVHVFGPLPQFHSTADRLVELTGSDKKKRSGTLSFILPTSIGTVEIVRDVTEAELKMAVEKMLADVRAQRIKT